MGTNTTPDQMRGLLVPTVNITKDNIWPEQSTFTEQNPRAGLAVPSQSYTGLSLALSGSQSQDITVKTIEGGAAGEKASFAFAGSDDVDCGQNANNVITDWKYLNFTNSVSSFSDYGITAAKDGTLYWVTELNNGLVYTITVRRQKQNGPIETLDTLLTTSLSGSPQNTAKPCIAVLKDGSIIVTFFNYTNIDIVNLFVWRSSDGGDNWQEISRRALVDNYINVGSSGFHLDTANLIVSDDIVTLVVGTRSKITSLGVNQLVQFVSRDSGTSFYALGFYGQDHAFPVGVALPNGQQGFAYISATDTLSFLKIPNPGIAAATSQYTNEYEVNINSGALTFASAAGSTLIDGTLACWYQDETIFVVVRDDNNDLYGFQSRDLGSSWEQVSVGFTSGVAQAIIYNGDSTVDLKNLKAAVWEGRTFLALNTTSGSSGLSLGGLYLGGWSSVQHPEREQQPDRNQYYGFDNNWIHNQTPDNTSIYGTTGAGTHTVNSEGLRIATSTNVRYYTYAPSVYHDTFYRFKMRVQNNALLTVDNIVFQVQTSDGSNGFTLNIRFATGGFRILDHSTTLHTENRDMTKMHEFMVFQDGTAVKVYFREWDEKQAKVWTEISVTLGTQSPGITRFFQWGHLSIGSFVSYWSEMHVSAGGIGRTSPELRGALYPSYGSYAYVDGGLLLSAKDAPARAGDEYKIAARYDYPIEHIFHEVALSPRVVWRSVDDTSTERIAWYTDPVTKSSEKNLGLNDVAGLHLSNINWKTATLKRWNGSSWSTIINIDVSTGLTGTYERKGATLVPTNVTKNIYLKYGECVGWRAELVDGENKHIIKIVQNSEGLWAKATDAKSAVLVMDSSLVDPTTLPTSGTINLIPDSITIVSELFQAATGAGEVAYAIEIPTQDTLEGYYQIGTMVFGSIYFMAPQYQRGRSISYDSNVQSYTTNDGMYYARKMSDGRRTFQVAWTEPVDSRSIYELNPDFWQFSPAADSMPVANYGDAVFGMLGIAQYLSEQKPVVYLPAIPKDEDEDGFFVFNRYYNHSLVRLSGGVTLESVIGEEEKDEMFRLATVTLIEVE